MTKQRRQDAPDAAMIERGEREGARRLLVQDQGRDQEARDDEEYVDANKAAAEPGDAGVIEHDSNDGNGAQAVDVGAIWQRGSPERNLSRRIVTPRT